MDQNGGMNMVQKRSERDKSGKKGDKLGTNRDKQGTNLNRQAEKAKANSKILKSCPLHEFEIKEIKDSVRKSTAIDWTRAKCKCQKCGGEVFTLYAGGYMDAVKQLKKLGEKEV